MYSYQGMPASSSTPSEDWTDKYSPIRMGDNFTAESPHGILLVESSGNTGEFGNPCWKISYFRKDKKKLGSVVCFGSNPQRDRAIGLRKAAEKLAKLRAMEGI